MIAVIAAKKRHFDEWIKAWVAVGDQKNFRLVQSPEQLRGIKFTDVVRIGPFWHLNDHERLYDEALFIKAKYAS